MSVAQEGNPEKHEWDADHMYLQTFRQILAFVFMLPSVSFSLIHCFLPERNNFCKIQFWKSVINRFGRSQVHRTIQFWLIALRDSQSIWFYGSNRSTSCPSAASGALLFSVCLKPPGNSWQGTNRNFVRFQEFVGTMFEPLSSANKVSGCYLYKGKKRRKKQNQKCDFAGQHIILHTHATETQPLMYQLYQRTHTHTRPYRDI